MGGLWLADGSGWRFSGENEDGSLLADHLARAMLLEERELKSIPSPRRGATKEVAIGVLKRAVRWRDIPAERSRRIQCVVGRIDDPKKLTLQLMRASHVVVHGAERNGGLLLHGALAAWKGFGVILCGPSGVGKSTASRRLPPPWHSLSDDTALIVKAADGRYWAHPWPTWSRYRKGNKGASWPVNSPVRLGLICMLAQKKEDRLAPLPRLQAVQELVEVGGQAFGVVANGLSREAFRRINLMRFRNATAIGRKIPVCRLEISRHGEFWGAIEEFLVQPRSICGEKT